MISTSLATEWAQLESAVLSSCSLERRVELRRAFYCGAHSCFTLLMQAAANDVDDGAKSVAAELERFMLELSGEITRAANDHQSH